MQTVLTVNRRYADHWPLIAWWSSDASRRNNGHVLRTTYSNAQAGGDCVVFRCSPTVICLLMRKVRYQHACWLGWETCADNPRNNALDSYVSHSTEKQRDPDIFPTAQFLSGQFPLPSYMV